MQWIDRRHLRLLGNALTQLYRQTALRMEHRFLWDLQNRQSLRPKDFPAATAQSDGAMPGSPPDVDGSPASTDSSAEPVAIAPGERGSVPSPTSRRNAAASAPARPCSPQLIHK